MSNYEMKCVFPDLFLLKIGEKKRKQKTLANVKFQLWRWFSALWPNFFREKKIKQFLITYMNNYSTRNSNKRGLKKLQSLGRTPYSRGADMLLLWKTQQKYLIQWIIRVGHYFLCLQWYQKNPVLGGSPTGFSNKIIGSLSRSMLCTHHNVYSLTYAIIFELWCPYLIPRKIQPLPKCFE